MAIALTAVVAFGVTRLLRADRSWSASQAPSGAVAGEGAGPSATPPWETRDVYESYRHLIPVHEGNWKLYSLLPFTQVDDSTSFASQLRQAVLSGIRFTSAGGNSSGTAPPSQQVMGDFASAARTALLFLGTTQSFAQCEAELLKNRRFKRDELPSWLFDSYKHVFDDSEPFETPDSPDSRKRIIADFFDEHRTEGHRDALVEAVSLTPKDGIIGLAYWLTPQSKDDKRLVKQLREQNLGKYWFGSIASPAFFLTEGDPNRDEIMHRDGAVLWAEAYIVVELANDDRFPIYVTGFYDPATKSWKVQDIHGQSSPLYASGIARIW